MVSKKTSVKKSKIAVKAKKKTTKKVVKKKTAVKKRAASKKRGTKKSVEAIIDTAKQEKELYSAIPIKYRRGIRDMVKKCKGLGYATSDIILEHVTMDECDESNDIWRCIYDILKNNCIDVVETEGLLKEVAIASDPRFPELDPSAYDSVQMYLRDIGKYPLLSAKEEQELGQKIIERKKLLEKKTRRKLTPGERRKILAEGAEARSRLALANLRLVVSIAKNYAGRSRNRDLSLLDLVQEGAEGLYRAVDKFDPGYGFKFSTYATHWIRQSIVRGLADKSRTIRIPVHMSETAQKYQKITVQLEKSLGRTPTIQEIADELGVESEKIHTIRRISQDIVQLEQTLDGTDEGSSTTISETIEDHETETQDTIVAQDILKNQVQTILKNLSPREREVIELRHGMTDGIQYTLEQIGNRMGVTRERVRQIEARALEKLRSNQVMKKLESY